MQQYWSGLPFPSPNIYTTICKIDSLWEFDVWLRELNPGLCNNLEGWEGVGGGSWEKGSEEGIDIYLWVIHVDVWQKPTQYCEEIILQLKIDKLKKKPVTAGSEDKEIIALGQLPLLITPF